MGMNTVEDRLEKIQALLEKIVFQNAIRGHETTYYLLHSFKDHAVSCREVVGTNLFSVTVVDPPHRGSNMSTLKVQPECCCIDATVICDSTSISKEQLQEFVDMINKEVSEERKSFKPETVSEWSPISDLEN